MGFPRQENRNGQPLPSPEDLPNPDIELGSPALQADSLPSEPGEAPSLPYFLFTLQGFPGGTVIRNAHAKAGDTEMQV